MACFSPLRAFKTLEADPQIFFKAPSSRGYMSVNLPCGQCIGCRLERSRQWAVRCMHEASQHSSSCFLTLTYRDDPVSLDPGDLRLFIKRLRKRFGAGRVRYFACGEYGDALGRPHFHALLFGVQFADRKPWKLSSGGEQLWISAEAEELWGHGFVVIGSVSFESAAYVARYVVKKRTGSGAAAHYRKVDPCTGEVRELHPEFVTMSLRPGIARTWIDRYAGEVLQRGTVVARGREMRAPRYYDLVMERVAPERMEGIRRDRAREGRARAGDSTFDRLEVRRVVAEAEDRLKVRML